MLNIKRFECNPFQENCYVVSDKTKEAVIIDCGAFYPEERETLVRYIRDQQLTPVRLLATHGHVDHNFGNDTVLDSFGLHPEVSGADKWLMDRLREQAMAFCGITLESSCFPAVNHYLHAGEKIMFGHHTFTLIPTPGHTPGSMFFYCKEEGVAFSGDTLFRMGIGRTDFEKGSYEDIVQSLQHIRQALPMNTKIYPGHGPQTVLGDEVKMNPYLKQ